MKGLGKRASFLALATILGTALLGSAYTLWYEQMEVDLAVSTTTLDASISCIDPADNESLKWPTTGPLFQAYPAAPTIKDEADAEIVVQPDYHRVEFLVSNAYPGYAWDCEVHIFNIAPLPWHLEDIQFSVEECDLLETNCVTLPQPPATWSTICQPGVCFWGNLGVNPPGYPAGLDTWSPVFAAVTNWEGCQEHEENFFGLSGSFFVGINQSAKELTKYKLVVTYQVNQWNESAWTGCNQPKPPV